MPCAEFTPAAVIARARALIGTPFAHQGRSVQGVDCGGFLEFLGAEFGVHEVGATDYARQPTATSLRDRLTAHLVEIKPAEIRPGDVVEIRFPRAAYPSHVALVTDYPVAGHLAIIHALNRHDGTGTVVEHRLDEQWRRRIVSAWRQPRWL